MTTPCIVYIEGISSYADISISECFCMCTFMEAYMLY